MSTTPTRTTRPTVSSKIRSRINATEEALRREQARLRPTEVRPASATTMDGQRPGINYQEILSPTVQYELYNPSDDPMEFGYAGETYVLPGASDLWVGRDARTGDLMEYTEPGVMPVFGRPELRIDALTIIRHATGDDGRTGYVGVNGVRPLFGDDRDPEVKAEARAAWVEKKRFDCESMVRAWEADVALATQQRRNPGRPPKRVKDAYHWIETNERVGGLLVDCPVCFDGFPSDRDMKRHIIIAHKRHPLAEAAREDFGLEADEMDRVVDMTAGGVEPAPEVPLPKIQAGVIDQTPGGTLSDEAAAAIRAEEQAKKDAARLDNKKTQKA